VNYFIRIDPVTKPRMTRSDVWKKRPAVVKYHQFKDDLRPYQIKLEPELEIEFELPMPKSWSKKKQAEMNGKPHQQTPDIDNLVKSLFDAVVDNDSYIYSFRATKRWAKYGSIRICQGD